MTKEDLLKKIDTWGVDHIAITGIKDCVRRFFESNVCISKGENRHPYADVLHEWLEGIATECSNDEESGWFNFTYDPNDVKFRIKQSELVYEWQWLDINPINHKAFFINEAKFMTEEECNTYTCYTIPIKIEETKRVRKGL